MNNNRQNRTKRNNNKRKKNKNNNSVSEGKINLFQNGKSPFPLSMQRANPFPPAVEVDLVFHSHVNFMNTGAASFTYVEYKVNDGFDPEAIVGGTQPAGWNAMGAIYGLAKVLAVAADIQCVNLETDNALTVGWILNDEQLSTTLTTVDRIKDALEVSPSSGPILLGTRDGDNIKYIRHPFIKLGDVIGNRSIYDGDTSYAQAINTSPSQLIWGLLVVYSDDDTVTIPLGIAYDVKLTMKIRFYSVRALQEP